MSKTLKMLVTTTVLMAGVAIAQPAGAATPGLQLTVSHPFVPVGSVGSWATDCFGQDFSIARAVLTYHASSPAGIARYEVTYDPLVAPPRTAHYQTNVPQYWSPDNYSGDCGGGGGDTTQGFWRVSVRDRSGATVRKAAPYYLSVVRWTNSMTGYAAIRPGEWTFGPGWKKDTCACADGGSQTFNTTRGGYAIYRARVVVAGEHRDLEMSTGPGRGRADIYVDGIHRATIDSSSPLRRSQVYTWDSGALSKGDHTIKVVNQATAGRQRIDINAMTSFS